MSDIPMDTMQDRIYAFIVEFINTEGMPPTNREIGHAVGIHSTGHVDYHLKMLERRGLITRLPGKARSIRLARPASGIPVIGAIAAGTPLDIFPETPGARELLPVDHGLLSTTAFALIVRGRSMIEEHICDGDYIVVNPQHTCQNGDIVVATHLYSGTSGSATLKRFFVEQDHIRLQPANSEMEPLVIPKSAWEQEWQIQGKVIAIFRQCSRTL